MAESTLLYWNLKFLLQSMRTLKNMRYLDLLFKTFDWRVEE